MDHDGAYAGSAYVSANSARRSLFPAVRWGAVLAGVAVGVSLQLVLTLFGIATGLSAADVTQGDAPGMGPLLWAAISMLIASFIGAYVAARMTGLKRKSDGVLHGMVTWAVTTLLFAALATSASGAMLSGVFGKVGAAKQNPPSVSSAVPQDLQGVLKSQIGGKAGAESMRTLADHIRGGRRDEAVRHLSGTMGVEAQRAETIVDHALIFSGSPELASEEGRTEANRAIRIAGVAAWTAFGAVLLSLLFGITGGLMGAIGARRTTWTDATTASVSNPAQPAA